MATTGSVLRVAPKSGDNREMALTITQFAVTGFDNNFSYLICDEQTKETAYVDPSGQYQLVLDQIRKNNLHLTAFLITHTHADHFDQLGVVSRMSSAPVYVHEAGLAKLPPTKGERRGLNEGSEIQLGKETVSVLHTPGHRADAVCFLVSGEESNGQTPGVITGDTLFIRGCGRTNESDVYQLYQSLQRLKQLPPQTIIYPGHDYGPTKTATLAEELEHNPYLLAEDLATFKEIRLG